MLLWNKLSLVFSQKTKGEFFFYIITYVVYDLFWLAAWYICSVPNFINHCLRFHDDLKLCWNYKARGVPSELQGNWKVKYSLTAHTAFLNLHLKSLLSSWLRWNHFFLSCQPSICNRVLKITVLGHMHRIINLDLLKILKTCLI